MDDSPQFKRRRSDTLERGQVLVERSTPWYDDGSIVVQAGNVQFRVHRTILAENSPMLSDLLEHQRDRRGEIVEGCPVLHLSDSADDVRYLLKVCYNRRLFSDEKCQPLSVIGMLLRIGGKYQIKHLHQEAISRLSASLPTTLKAYDEVGEWPNIVLDDSLAADVANLCRHPDLLSMLPCALLYAVCDLTVAEILQGILRKDGSIATLLPENRDACIMGLEALRTAQVEHTFSYLDGNSVPSELCTSRIECKKFWLDQVKVYWMPPPFLNPVDAWKSWWDQKLCKSCLNVAKESHSAGRQYVWDNLPSYFGLPTWEQLSVG